MDKLLEYLEGKNRAAFARELQISAPYLHQILGGQRRPSFRLMEKIEKASDGAVPLDAWRASASSR